MSGGVWWSNLPPPDPWHAKFVSVPLCRSPSLCRVSWRYQMLALFPSLFQWQVQLSLPISHNWCPDRCMSSSSRGVYFWGGWLYHNFALDTPDLALLHINYKEVLAQVFAVFRWAPCWANQHVIIHSDNEAVPAQPAHICQYAALLARSLKTTSIPNYRVVTTISSCWVNTTSGWGIKRLGISFGSIFLLFSTIIHLTHDEKSDWSRAFNQFTITCELDMINAISAAHIAFIMSSSTSAWLPSPLECSPQKQNGWTLCFCFWGWIIFR